MRGAIFSLAYYCKLSTEVQNQFIANSVSEEKKLVERVRNKL